MYCHFFGFAEKPFDVTPDPKFLYLTPGHRETLAALTYGIAERRGFITVVGEVGTGKTTLLNTVLGRLDEKVRAAFIFNTDLTFDEMLTLILFDLGLVRPDETLPKMEALLRLHEFAIRQLLGGGNVVLIVDEAQNLDHSAMEKLRLLSNLETRKHKLIQIILSGQPELDVKLNQPELRQLRQRISLRRYITPLSEKETYEYIQHRLTVAGYSGPSLFNRQTQKMTWEYSGGVPRKINVLCDNALLIGYALRQKSIEASVIEEAIRDLNWSPFSSSRRNQATDPVQPPPRSRGRTSHSRFATAASFVFAAAGIFLVALVLGTSGLNLPGSGLLPVWTSNQAKIPMQLSPPDQSPTLRQPVSHEQAAIAQEGARSTLLQEKPESGDAMVLEAPHGNGALSVGPAGVENQNPTANPEPSPSETGESQTREARVVVVKRGENLSQIIFKTYGRNNGTVLGTVLQENPEIQNPDRIMAGEVIKLPEQQ